MLAHTSKGTGSPQNLKGEQLKLALKFSVKAPITLQIVGAMVSNLTKLYQETCWEAGVITRDNEGTTLGGPPPTKFGRAKTSKIWHDF